jgi:2'-5' RNA ligase
MPESLRAFIALPMSDGAVRFCKRIQQQLRSPAANIRWVPVKNIHLTLKFLADIDPAVVPAVTDRLDAAAASVPSFWLTPKGVGAFPNRRRARVLWIGLAGDLDRLGTLHAALESGLETVGFKRESRGFRAHLTIGRPRKPIDPKVLGAILEPVVAAVAEPFRVDQLRLYRSVLKPSGAEYSLLHTAQLKTGQPVDQR